MKKLLTILGILTIIQTGVYASEQPNCRKCKTPDEISKQEFKQREQAFEQRLGLTDEQKNQAKAIRDAGFEKIKPIFDNLKSLENETALVKQSKLSEKEKEEKLNTLNENMQTLRKQAHAIKRENMKDFEELLTPEQKKILKDMKQEGRANYQKNHPQRNIKMHR